MCFFMKNLKAAVRYPGSSDFFVLVDKNLQKFAINSDLSYAVNLIYFKKFSKKLSLSILILVCTPNEC